MELSIETVAIAAIFLAIGSLEVVVIESIFTPDAALAYDKKCKVDQLDESLCVLGIPDPDFEEK